MFLSDSLDENMLRNELKKVDDRLKLVEEHLAELLTEQEKLTRDRQALRNRLRSSGSRTSSVTSSADIQEWGRPSQHDQKALQCLNNVFSLSSFRV
jgi:hypothetical protein